MKIKKLYEDSQIPTYAHSTDAGLDLYVWMATTIPVGQRRNISTGIAVEIPQGYFGLIRPRSGLSTKNGITTISSGVIDEGYRGEIHVGLVNLGEEPYRAKKGSRIAQLLIIPVIRPIIEVVNKLSDTDRGETGHGSTGL